MGFVHAVFPLAAQPSGSLVQVQVPFPNVYVGDAAWGDYDNDGDLDLVIAGTGLPAFQPVTRLFRNDGNGSFVAGGFFLPQLRSSSVAWGDYDNDGDLDLALCGVDADGVVLTRIFRNDGGGNFSNLNVNLEGGQGTVLWRDFDNDGDLDMFLNGGLHARIYRNDKGTFRDAHVSLYSQAGSATSADYDNNGFWDILAEGGGGYFPLYGNRGAWVFNYVTHPMVGGGGDVAWGDFNGDGYSDLLVTGGPFPQTATRIYRSVGGAGFTNLETNFPPVGGGIASCADYDNDGRLDFFLGGNLAGSNYIARLYHNDGAGNFSQSAFSATGVASGAAVWGDYDNDGKLDLLLLGLGYGTSTNVSSWLFHNNSPIPNYRPGAPQNLSSSVINTNSVILSWSASVDSNQLGGLTYNLRIGTTPGGSEVFSSMSDAATGYRRVAQGGNTGHRTSWILENLTKGSYYWSVQAVDYAFAGSAFAPERRFFIISPVMISDIPNQRISVSASTAEIPFTISDSETDPATLTVSASSSNMGLVPVSAIVFGGAGSSRTVRVTPVPGQRGSAVITITVRNTSGQFDRDTFTVVVDNFPPTISSIPDQFTAAGQSTALISFTVGDLETPADSLVVSARSSNTNLVSNDLIVLGGSGTDRNIRVSPRAGQTGAATILVTVFDARGGSAVEGFQFYSGASRPTFTVVSNDLPGMQPVKAAWGDYDGDGDPDVLMAGAISSNAYATVVYRNEGNDQFTNAGVPLPGLAEEPVGWCDPDSDGDLDIFLSRDSTVPGPTGALIAANMGNGNFSRLTLPRGASYGAFDWGDYDNDGDQDLILGGSGMDTTIYRNNGSFNFTQLDPSVYGTYVGYLAWGDSDRDGDLDLFLMGELGASFVTQIYRNDGGSLTPVATAPPDARWGEGHWGDYDNDGDLDLLFSGWTGTPDLALTQVYRNDGNNSFTPIPSARIANLWATTGWGDYDSDGDLDFFAAGTVLHGSGSTTPHTAVYRNEGGDVFVNAGLSLPQIGARAAGQWIDYDNDGDLDLFLAGNSAPWPGVTRTTVLLRNNSIPRNSVPTPPQNLTAVVHSNTVTFSWSEGSDENQGAGLTYNLRVGTTPGGNELVSSMSLSSGQRLLAKWGNAAPLRTRTLYNVPYGTYYWSVQTIDHSYAGSAFAPEQSFLINSPPQISNIANRNISYANSSPIPFTINDVETPLEDLQLSATSSDPNVIPNGNIVFGGGGANRTIQLIPITTQGSAIITVTVTDGHQATATDTFAVSLINTPPTISNIPNQTNSYVGDTGLIPFTIYDPETPADELVLTVSSSSPTIPATNIVFGGSGSNRTVRITPSGQQPGLSSLITIAVRDPLLATTLDTFFVYFVNIRPTISPIPDQTFTLGDPIPEIPFTVGDYETDTSDLTVSASSSSQALVRNSDMVISGTGSNRTLRINIPLTRSGSATLSVTVSDGYGGNITENFTFSILQFSEVPVELPGFACTALSWVDLDSDGLLDLFGSGTIGEEPFTRVIYNLGAEGFWDLGPYFPQMRSAAAWGDYDGDLDLDLMLVGEYPGGGYYSLLYANRGGFGFEPQPATFPGFDGSGSWADYDNDGDLDLLLAGAVGTNFYARIYRNDRGNFVDSGTAFPGVVLASSAWGDYDGDGDLDLMLLGTTISAGIGDVARLYRNDRDGVFTQVTNTAFRGGSHGSVDWGDYDRDGDLDLLLTGLAGGTFNRVDAVYRNNGSSGPFTEISLPGEGVAFGSGQWGDFDNDGDLDILLAGHTGSQRVLRVYRNDNNAFQDIQAMVPGIDGKAVWGDFDRDGDLDIALAGRSTNLIFKLFENHQPNSNAIPTAPISLGSFAGSNFVRLSWSAATDANQTAPKTYNLRVGTAPGASDVMSPMSLLSTGERLLPAMGNVNHNQIWTLTGLPRGRYYWSVQAVDHSFAGSAFAPEQSFVVQHRPAISPIADVTLPVNVAVPPIDFTISDFEDSPDSLALRVTSSNTNLLPLANIEVIGSGSNRTLRLLVATNRAGNATVEVTVTDLDGAFASESFILRITNAVPTISSIPDRSVGRNVTIGLLPFTIGDLETPAENLVLTAFSTNTTLVPNENIVFGGSGSNRTVTVTPALDQVGRTAISIRVTDAHGGFAATEFVIRVLQFHVAGADLLQNTNATLAWGDYDNDGDQDLLLAGMVNTNRHARLLRNEGNGTFSEAPLSLPAVSLSAVAWVDYDNDADLDFMICGQTASSNNITRLYRNDGSNGFALSAAQFPGVSQPVLAWGDYDNDGDQDVFLAGMTNAPYFAFSWLFQNQGGNAFTLSPKFFQPYFNGSAAWADYDNDGDLDLSVAGEVTPGTYGQARLYKNTRGNFSLEYPPVFEGYPATSLGWSDFDNDSDLDLLLAGSALSFQASTGIYRNNGTGVLSRLNVPHLVSVSSGGGAWADIDNDGFGDFVVAGLIYPPPGGASGVAQIYRNVQGSNFVALNESLLAIIEAKIAPADYDNDGDLDLLFSGAATNGRLTRLYRNETPATNAPPAPPTNLLALTGVRAAFFSWSAATDPNQNGGFTYNLRVGTTPGGSEIVSAMSDAATGYRRVPQIGNVNHRLSWTITNLTARRYYWSVQAIDHSFAGSGFAPEQSFIIQNPPTISDLPNRQIMPNTALSNIAFSVGDIETPPANLVLTAASSNTNLVSSEGLIFGGAGNARTLTVIPSSNRTGVATITITVRDEDNGVASDSFMLTVTNTRPLISGPANRMFLVNTPIPEMPLSMSDSESPADELVLAAFSSNTNLVRDEDISFGGSGQNRTLRVLALPDVIGTTRISVLVTDPAGLTNGIAFDLRILETNSPPTITDISDLIRRINTSPVLLFSIADAENSAAELLLAATSSDTNLIPAAGLVLGGSGSNRNLRITPAVDRAGSAMITVVITDELGASASDSFRIDFTNGPPNILPLANRSVNVAIWSQYFSLAVSDAESPAAALQLSAASSDQAVIPDSNIQFQFTNSSWRMRFLPQQVGLSTITVTVRDPLGEQAAASFVLTVFNNSPLIDAITNRVVRLNGPVPPIPIKIYDVETPPQDLALTITSSNLALLPEENIFVSGTSSNRTLTLLPVANVIGASEITLYVADAHGRTNSRSFVLYVVQFGPVATPFTNGSGSAIAWGDYDADGWMDLALSGLQAGTNLAPKIYRNNGVGSFYEIPAGLPNVNSSTLSWADYDNDGDLDLLVAGRGTNLAVTALYRNDLTNGFTPVAADLPPVIRPAAAWADYDNDGRLDLLLAGASDISNLNSFCGVFRQIGPGQFVYSGTAFPPLLYSSAEWGDYDNDGDADLALVGQTNQATGLPYFAFVYRNTGNGNLVDLQLPLRSSIFSSVSWVDYDGDGDLDLFFSGGFDTNGANTQLHRNDGQDRFTPVATAFPFLYDLKGNWGDFDADGDLDVAVTADAAAFLPPVRVYRNDGAALFTDIVTRLPSDSGMSAWADFDNDSDLDLAVSGTRLYGNFGIARNLRPEPPSDLQAAVSGDIVELRWGPALDSNQPQPLTYNLRVGSAPGAADVVTPHASAAGTRLLVRRGNTDYATHRVLRNLRAGSYYWSVQAVDHSFAGSPFAPDQHFVVGAPELIQPHFAHPTNFQFWLRGLPGNDYVIEYSSDLKSWTPLRMITLTTNHTVPVLDAILAPDRRFYRARTQ